MSAPPTAAEAVEWTAPAKPHRGQLFKFECCHHEERTKPYQLWKHSKPWRLHAQKLVRRMPTPCRPPQFGIFGIDSQGIAAAAWFEIDGGIWHINVAAVALRWQGRGLGDQLMDRVLSRILEHATENDVQNSDITARVHPLNRESLALLRRYDFTQAPEPDRPDDVYPLWGMRLPTRL